MITHKGRWQTPVHPDLSTVRPYGLLLMHSCMKTVAIDHDSAGTTVTLTARPIFNDP